MQLVGLAAAVLLVLLGATAWALRRRDSPAQGSLLRQLQLGVAMGFLGLFVVLVLMIDFIPDEIEGALIVVVAAAAIAILAFLSWWQRQP